MGNKSISKFCKLNLISLCDSAGKIRFFQSINRRSNILNRYDSCTKLYIEIIKKITPHSYRNTKSQVNTHQCFIHSIKCHILQLRGSFAEQLLYIHYFLIVQICDYQHFVCVNLSVHIDCVWGHFEDDTFSSIFNSISIK